MKPLSLLPVLSVLLAAAQTVPAPSPRNPTPAQAKVIKAHTAERRAASYKGPKVVKNDKALGRKFIQESKPAPVSPGPVNQ